MIGSGTPSNQRRIPRPIVCSYILRGVRTRSFQVPSRKAPPSAAARLAANAPKSSAAVSQKDRCTAFLRAMSAAVFASLTTWLTRLFVRLAQARPGGHDLSDISSVVGAESVIIAEIGGPQAQDFCSRPAGIAIPRIC